MRDLQSETVILHAFISKLRIGTQFDDVNDKTNVSGGELPNLPKIEFSELNSIITFQNSKTIAYI